MTQPIRYARKHDFTLDESDDISTSSLNSEFDAIQTTTDGIRTNLAAIQNDDLSLKAGIVGLDQLDEEVTQQFVEATKQSSDYVYQAAERAEKLLEDVDALSDRVEAAWEKANEDRQGASQLAGQVSTNAAIFTQLQNQIVTVANNATNISTAAQHIEDIHAIGQDLLGTNLVSVDLGLVRDEADPINDGDSSLIGQILEHIDEVTEVGENIDAVVTDANSITGINTVADNIDAILAVASRILAVQNVSDNMASVTGAVTAASTAAQSASSALAAEARIQALEDQINEIVSTNYVAVSEGTN